MLPFHIAPIAVALALLVVAALADDAAAAKLYPVKVPDMDIACPTDERRIEGLKHIRIVRSGCEDGADQDFVRINKDGTRTRLFGFVAVARDAAGVDWTGISDQAKVLPSRMGKAGLEVWVSFAHSLQPSGNVCLPLGQRRYPLVLFSFDGDPPSSALRAYRFQKKDRFRRIPLSQVVAETRRVPPGGKANLECDTRCCYPVWRRW